MLHLFEQIPPPRTECMPSNNESHTMTILEKRSSRQGIPNSGERAKHLIQLLLHERTRTVVLD